MIFWDVCMEIFWFIVAIPVVTVLLTFACVFWTWKRFAQLIISCSVKKIHFLSSVDVFFLSFERKSYFHLAPRKFTPLYCILQGNLSAETIQAHFQKDILTATDGKGRFIFEKLQQRITKKFGYYVFVKDEKFQIQNHIRTVETSVSDASMMDFVKTANAAPIMPDSPLWEFVVVPKFNDEDKTLIVFRAHHSYLDGYSFTSVVRRGCSNGTSFSKRKQAQPMRTLELNSKSVVQRCRAFYQITVALPRRFILEQADKRHFPTKFASEEYFSQTPKKFSMSSFKKLKIDSDVSITHANVTCLAYALSKARIGELAKVDWLSSVITTSPPKSPADEMIGNNIALLNLNLPTTCYTLETTFRKCDKELKKSKEAVSGKLTAALWTIGSVFPSELFIKFFVPKVSEFDGIVFSSMPGPSTATDYLGHKVLNLNYYIPPFQNPWLTLTMLTYNGEANITVAGLADNFKTKSDLDTFSQEFYDALGTRLNGQTCLSNYEKYC